MESPCPSPRSVMEPPSPRSFSFRRLLRSIFVPGDGADASPRSSRSSRWSRHSGSRSPSASPARSPSAWSAQSPSMSSASSAAVHGDASSQPYVPSRLDGEFNVWFEQKPLGVGLVPSSQLYGTWEVSTVAPTTASANRDEVAQHTKVQTGDVVIAVNFNTRVAKLPHDALEAYLQQSAFPVVLTFRRPDFYGSCDSRAMSTAMFPLSTEYRGLGSDIEPLTFHVRAPSSQWRHSVEHELTRKEKKHRPRTRRSSRTRVTSDSPPCMTMDPVPEGAVVHLDAAAHEVDVRATAELTTMGEYSVTFREAPLRVVFAPSTRLYGSIEVFDPMDHAPVIQVGDVVTAVNGETAVVTNNSRGIDPTRHLKRPVVITFRRPAAYRKYLKTYFHATQNTVSSRSIATAMFPNSAEYKHRRFRQGKKASSRARPRRGSTETMLDQLLVSPRPSSLRTTQEERRRITQLEWRLISTQFSTRDQFKLWQSGAAKRAQTTNSKQVSSAKHSSGFLTERHVQYLWSHLPEYLTCNDMELVYDTRHHGWNLLTFYAHVQGKGPTLLVVKDTKDQIFGAFSSTSWKKSVDVYGNGRSFVFSLRPQMKVYAWSGLNDTFMSGRNNSVVMGGGKKGIALCLQIDECRGFSQACETFDSPPLADGGIFDMESMEVWCFSGLRV